MRSIFTFFLLLALMVSGKVWGQQIIGSYPNMNGGFEASDIIDNSTTFTSAQSGKWVKNNSSTTISEESTIVRSGVKSLSITNNTTTGRRVWSPLITVSSTTSNVTIQFFRRVTNTSNTQESQAGIGDGTTTNEGTSGTYNTPSTADNWEKFTYTRNSWTFTNIAGVIFTRQKGTGGNLYVDDFVMYNGAVDITAPNSPGTVTVNNATSSSLDVSWVAASGGVDGGGYVVVRYSSSPNADNDPNQNGIYAVGNTHTNGTGSLTGTIRYIGTGTSFTDNVGLSENTTYWYKVYTVDKAFNYSTESQGSGTTSASGTPSIAISAEHPESTNIQQGSTNNILASFKLDVTVAAATLNGISVTTAGTYSASDIATNGFKFWINSSNNLSGATQLGTSQAAVGSGGSVAVSGLSQAISSGTTRYILITADISTSAEVSKTISITSTAFANITFASGNKTGTDPVPASNEMTIIACTPTNVTSLSLTPGNAQIAVSWSNPSCFDEIMIVAKPGASISASPSGDGGAYTANLSFGSGSAFDGTGYVVYKGSTSPQTITGLTNGTTYYVKAFTRRGTVWSDGVESSSSPVYTSSTSDYFRSKATGNWNAAGTWESSPNGSDWYDATLTPTSSANTITIRNGHTVTITASVTIDQVAIESGGTLTHTGGTITVDNGTGDDIQVNDGGAFVLSLASTAPSFNSEATCLISTGGILRVTTTGLTANGAGVNLANFVYQNASILEYTSTSTFSASGVTFFPNADANTIPVFRVTALTASPGGASNTVINGILEANSSFTWAGSGTKTFRNGLRGSGTLTQGTNGQWIISGTTAELSGTGELVLGTNGLVINSGATVTSNSTKTISGGTVTNNGTLTVSSSGALTVSGTLSNSGTLNIKSDASGTGSLIHSSSGVSATVERYFAGTEQWRLVSSPVASQSISGGWTPSGTYPSGHGYDFYAWDEATSTWLNQRIAGNNITSFVPAKGYLVSFQASNPTKEFSGALNTGSVSISLTKTGSGDYSGTNLVGNPYPSSIDWKAASGWSRSMLKDDDAGEGVGYTMYIYNPSANNYGAYISNSSSDEGTQGVTRYIPPMQGFFVVANSAGSFGMDNNVRVHNNAGNFLKNKGAETNIIRASVTGANVGSDEVMIEIGNKQGGAPKWNSMVATAPSLWVSKNDKRYSIYFHHNNQQTESLPVSFKAGANGQYTLSFEFAQGQYQTLKLQDLKTNIIHDLLAANSYAFSATTSDDPNRFLIIFGTVGVDEKPAAQAQLQAYMANGLLWVNNPAENSRLAVFDLSGRLLVQQQLRSRGLQQLGLNLQKGAYILRLTEGNSSLSTKVINQ